ncbi:MAG: DUF3343 domain-containing protein [Clostridiales bacterium]|nr:DUF3343 domain-containing protein [Clostridiales bacterium]
MIYYIIVYKNTHDAMEADKILSEKGFEYRIMPTPTSVTQSCGICTRLKKYNDIEYIVNNNIFEFKNIYEKNEDEFKLIR